MNLEGYALVGRVWGHDIDAFDAGKIDKNELLRRAQDFEKNDKAMKKIVAKLIAERER
jgi:hypothetical protein